MFKKILVVSAILLVLPAMAQKILPVTELTQQYEQWCWAGSSKSILDYYGFNYAQCDLANYTRLNATFYNFGTVDCCLPKSTPGWSCNNWNYNWGNAGSIDDIFVKLAKVKAVSKLGRSLSEQEYRQQIDGENPFVIRWGWTAGGGHFIVGNGYGSSGNVYVMDPWTGEGIKLVTYAWVNQTSDKRWEHTQTFSHARPVSSSSSLLSSSSSELSSSSSSQQLSSSSSEVVVSSSSIELPISSSSDQTEPSSSDDDATPIQTVQHQQTLRLLSVDRQALQVELRGGKAVKVQALSATGRPLAQLHLSQSGRYHWNKPLPRGVHFLLFSQGNQILTTTTFRVAE